MVIIWLLVIGYCTSLYAVNGVAADPSRSIFSARQVALGGTSIGFSDDASGIFSHPAGLSGFEFPQMIASSRKIMLDETQYTLAGAAIPSDFGTFGIGYIGMDTAGSLPTTRDSSNQRIIQNASLESSSYLNNVIAVSYTRKLPANASIGVNYKTFNQSLSGGGISDQGAASNLDLSFTASPFGWFSIGASAQNLLGGTVKWTSTEDKLTSRYRLGGAAHLIGGTVGLDLEIPDAAYHLGIEYPVIKDVFLRAGLNSETNGSGLALGIGLVNGGFRFDYAYAQRPGLPADTPHYFSLSYIGERTASVERKLKKREVKLTFSNPRDRTITSFEAVDLSVEVSAYSVFDQKRTWIVTGLSATHDAFEVTESVLPKVYVNGKLIAERAGTIESHELLGVGRNILQVVAYTSPEVVSPKLTIPAASNSSEAKVLRVIPFNDVPLDFWAMEPIYLSVTLGLVKGYPDNTFGPDRGISRSELVTLLVRSLGIPQDQLTNLSSIEVFKDVPASNWAMQYINYGSSLKFVTGYPDGGFKPNKVLNRAEAITIMARYAGLSEEAAAISPFSDLKPDFWANKFIAPARNAGLLKYLEGKEFSPSAEFTRAEACEVLYRVPAIQKKVNEFWETGLISAGR